MSALVSNQWMNL